MKLKYDIVNLNYVQDLEDCFALECSKEDLETDKEARACFRKIRRIRRRANRLCDFLDRLGEEMQK